MPLNDKAEERTEGQIFWGKENEKEENLRSVVIWA